MTHQWDEFSKSLAERVPRRESLRRLGLVFAGAVLTPLGTAWAGGADPCKAFCNQCPKSRRSQCLAACEACGKDTSRLAGRCGNFICCGAGQASCGSYCADLANDPYNCGTCGNICPASAPYCNQGACSVCPPGAALCGGECTDILWDSSNCGGCGIVCGGSTPYCYDGACHQCAWGPDALCDGRCVDLLNDPDNCGACGVVCDDDEYCAGGVCQTICIPDCGPGSTHGEGWCGDDGCGGRCPCPDGMYCPPNSNACAASVPPGDGCEWSPYGC